MAEKAGKTGRISYDNGGITQIMGIQNWSMNYEVEPLETTTFEDSGNKTFIAGLKNANGSFEGFDQNAAPVPAVGSIVTLYLYIDQPNNKFYSFSALITQANISTGVSDVNKVSYSYQSTGAITEVV